MAPRSDNKRTSLTLNGNAYTRSIEKSPLILPFILVGFTFKCSLKRGL